MTIEELNANLNVQLKDALVKVAGKLKDYSDGQDALLKTELKEQIVSELTQIDGLGAQLEKIQKMADNFAEVFDANEDGMITPEEILAKMTVFQTAINSLSDKLDILGSSLEEFKASVDSNFKEVEAELGALKVSAAQNADAIATLRAETVSFVRKDDLAIELDVDGIVDAVADVLFPTAEVEAGDGAVE